MNEHPKNEHPWAVTDASFATDVLAASGPVLVDFWAEWCGPCRTIAPALEELAGEFAGRLQLAKVNIDENPETPSTYAVRGIPTLILFKDGKPAATQVGAAPKSRLKAWIESSLKAS
ncbi:MAG: thioredoxin [Acetobacteraceae bacterium]